MTPSITKSIRRSVALENFFPRLLKLPLIRLLPPLLALCEYVIGTLLLFNNTIGANDKKQETLSQHTHNMRKKVSKVCCLLLSVCQNQRPNGCVRDWILYGSPAMRRTVATKATTAGSSVGSNDSRRVGRGDEDKDGKRKKQQREQQGWIVVLLAVIVLLALVGGIVGTRKSKHNNNNTTNSGSTNGKGLRHVLIPKKMKKEKDPFHIDKLSHHHNDLMQNHRELLHHHYHEQLKQKPQVADAGVLLPPNSIYRLSVQDGNDQAFDLNKFAGMVTLVVNVACK